MNPQWKTRTDIFGAPHVYDEGGDRLTNDHMSRTQGWDRTCRFIEHAPKLLSSLQELVILFESAAGQTGDAKIDLAETQAIDRAAGLIQKITGEIK